jgi:hypothetical protein
MAHEAFALSPTSARAAQPAETDYEAIREAFMETARGRWFLGEYAKRNRHADTRRVLNAVARIERTLEAMQQPPPDARLPAIIWNVVDQAEEAAASAVDRLAVEQRLAPIRKGAQILKKISWRWREIGTDSRICDAIDSQVEAIQESCDRLAGIDIRAELTGATPRPLRGKLRRQTAPLRPPRFCGCIRHLVRRLLPANSRTSVVRRTPIRSRPSAA